MTETVRTGKSPLLLKRQLSFSILRVWAFCITQFVCEDESLHHALVHQGLLCRAVWDQLDALGLELVVRDTLHMAYLEVQARSNRLVEYDVSVLEGRELVGRGWDYFFLSWKNATFQNIEQNNFVFFFCIAVMLSLF